MLHGVVTTLLKLCWKKLQSVEKVLHGVTMVLQKKIGVVNCFVMLQVITVMLQDVAWHNMMLNGCEH